MEGKFDKLNLASKVLPPSFVISLISQFDAYVGRLIRTMFFVKPEMLNTSQKNLLFSELVTFKSLEDAKEYVVEKEIVSVMRESHIKQFTWLEGKLGIPLRKDLYLWPTPKKFFKKNQKIYFNIQFRLGLIIYLIWDLILSSDPPRYTAVVLAKGVFVFVIRINF